MNKIDQIQFIMLKMNYSWVTWFKLWSTSFIAKYLVQHITRIPSMPLTYRRGYLFVTIGHFYWPEYLIKLACVFWCLCWECKKKKRIIMTTWASWRCKLDVLTINTIGRPPYIMFIEFLRKWPTSATVQAGLCYPSSGMRMASNPSIIQSDTG